MIERQRKPAPRAALLAAAAFAVSALSATAVLAYIPSAASLLRRAAARVNEGGRSREVTLSGSLTVGTQARPATLKLHFPLACSFDSSGQGASAIRAPDGSGVQVTDNGLGPDAADLVRLACPLIAYRGQTASAADQSLRNFLSSVGVSSTLAPTSLARLYDRVAIVLGASVRQLDRPQLWLYKDNAAPARLLALTNGSIDDLRLLQYGNPASADWFPRSIELWRGTTLRARFEVDESHGINNAADDEEPPPDEPHE